MKKLLLITAVAITAMFVTSCQGPAGPVGPQGPRGEDGISNVHKKDIIISNWTKDYQSENDLNGYYWGEATVDWFTSALFNGGAFSVYMINGAELIALPFSEWWDDGEDIYELIIHHRVNITNKKIYFLYSTSDFMYSNDGPPNITFRLIGIW